jgi:hypothetical protein
MLASVDCMVPVVPELVSCTSFMQPLLCVVIGGGGDIREVRKEGN